MVCEACSWLLHDIGEPNTLWAAPQVGLGCLRKVRHRGQASKQYKQRSSMVPASVPASRLLPWAPAFISRSKGLLSDVYEMNPSKAATGHRACPSNWRATQNINVLGRPRETKRSWDEGQQVWVPLTSWWGSHDLFYIRCHQNALSEDHLWEPESLSFMLL